MTKTTSAELIAQSMVNVTCDGMDKARKFEFNRKLAEHLREKSNTSIETVRFCKEWIKNDN